MGNKLLLADDSITIQKVVAIIFANEEFELSVVDNGDAALARARDIQPDVMLVDALMPGKTGYEVCAEIRRDPKLATVPILLLIGAFEPLDEEKVRSCGADATISKPFESQQLIEKVKELLETGKARKAAPAAAPAPAATAPAEDLWSDLSALDTTAPPAAARPAKAPAPAAQGMAATQAPAGEEILEATLEDDLWGAFDVEEAPAAAPSSAFGVVEPGGEFEAEEFFTFEEDEGVVDTGPALELDEPVVQASAEELFSFAEEAEAQPAAEPEAAPFDLPEYEPFSLEEENIEPAASMEAPEAEAAAAQPAPGWGVPAEEPALEAAPAAASQTGQAAVSGLSEADLREALSKISREVIERVVWEVVPDLAEALIKEEIKKLREGARS